MYLMKDRVLTSPNVLIKVENLDGFQIGKRGLSLVKSVADSIEVNGSTISLTFRKKQ